MIDVDKIKAGLATVGEGFAAVNAELDQIYVAIKTVIASSIEVSSMTLAEINTLKARATALEARLTKLETPAPVVQPAPIVQPMRLGAPFYVRADTAVDKALWSRLIAKGPSKVGLIVFNPSTGVGSVANPAYQAQVAAARAAGIKIGVYVPTGYLDMFGYSAVPTVSADGIKRDPANVQNILDELTRARSFYGQADAVFLDEMNNKPLPEVLTAYGKVRDHIRTLFGTTSLIVQNPGTLVPEEMMGIADVFMRFESGGAKYLSFVPPAWHAKYPGRFWDCAHTCDPTKLGEYVAAAKRNKPGLIWLTDDGDTNQYNSLPAFLDPLCAAVGS